MSFSRLELSSIWFILFYFEITIYLLFISLYFNSPLFILRRIARFVGTKLSTKCPSYEKFELGQINSCRIGPTPYIVILQILKVMHYVRPYFVMTRRKSCRNVVTCFSIFSSLLLSVKHYFSFPLKRWSM